MPSGDGLAQRGFAARVFDVHVRVGRQQHFHERDVSHPRRANQQRIAAFPVLRIDVGAQQDQRGGDLGVPDVELGDVAK